MPVPQQLLQRAARAPFRHTTALLSVAPSKRCLGTELRGVQLVQGLPAWPNTASASTAAAVAQGLPEQPKPASASTVAAVAGALAFVAGATCARGPVCAEDGELRNELLDDREAVRAAVMSGLWPRVEAWVDQQGLEAILKPSMGQTALSVAAETGSIFIVRALLGRAADPESCDKHGLSVLCLAARQGHAPVVLALLDSRAMLERADIFGNAAIHGAVGFAHTSVLRTLLAARSSPELRTGDVRAPASYGAQTLHETPLHLSCRQKPPHLELRSQSLVRILLHYGASPCDQDDRGDTPVHLLVRKGDAATLWFLLSRSAPELAEHAAFNVRNLHGQTAKEEASLNSSIAIKLGLHCGLAMARMRKHLGLQVGDGFGEDGVDEAAEEESWRAYREHMEKNPSIMPFEEGGDGVRRRAR